MSITRATIHPERGQTLLIFVLALTVLLGFTAMAIDVGLFMRTGATCRTPQTQQPWPA